MTTVHRKRRILVVEDEETLQVALRFNLEREGYEVVVAGDGVEAIELAQRDTPDLVLLDLMLPRVDGFEVCRSLRRSSNVPIIMLTARSAEIDRVVGLELGADDYISKPFSMRELIARVKAVLRRTEATTIAASEAAILQFGDLTMDVMRREASRNGQSISLKPKEYDLLHFFLQHPHQVFSRDQILDAVWGYRFAGGTRTVDVHVRWLREKIEDDPAHPVRIQTVRGVGYRFEG